MPEASRLVHIEYHAVNSSATRNLSISSLMSCPISDHTWVLMGGSSNLPLILTRQSIFVQLPSSVDFFQSPTLTVRHGLKRLPLFVWPNIVPPFQGLVIRLSLRHLTVFMLLGLCQDGGTSSLRAFYGAFPHPPAALLCPFMVATGMRSFPRTSCRARYIKCAS